METIIPAFKNDEDKNIIIISLILSLFLGFIPMLIVLLAMKEKLSESSLAITKAFLNFELLLFIISIIFMVVPVIGWIIGIIGVPIVIIASLLFPIMALIALANNQPVKVLVLIKFVK